MEVIVDLGLGTWRETAVRLVGIESHELDGPQGARARMIAEEVTERYQMRRCVVWPARRGLDCYGRLRARVIVCEKDLGETLVADGLAWVVKFPLADHTHIDDDDDRDPPSQNPPSAPGQTKYPTKGE